MKNNYYKIDESLLKSVLMTKKSDDLQDCIVYCSSEKAFLLIKEVVENFNGLLIKKLDFINAYGVKISSKNLIKLSQNNLVAYISPLTKVSALMDKSKVILNVDKVHEKGYLGQNKTIAFIDTGIASHADFVFGKNRIIAFHDTIGDINKNYDDNGHGSFVAGVASGSGVLSGKKYSGIAPMANIVAVKGLASNGEASAVSILESMQWVLDNKAKYDIKVVCMSFGSEPLLMSDPIIRGAEKLWDSGLVVVAAAGNSGPEKETIKSPGASRKIITVGGFDDGRETGKIDSKNFSIAQFSSRGPSFNRYKPDIVAPSVDIMSCGLEPSQPYISLSGTSVATPMIAGLCLLIIQKFPRLMPAQVKTRLLSSCKGITFNRNDEGFGYPDAFYCLFR